MIRGREASIGQAILTVSWAIVLPAVEVDAH